MNAAHLLYGPADDVAAWLSGDGGAYAQLEDLRGALANALNRIHALELTLARARSWAELGLVAARKPPFTRRADLDMRAHRGDGFSGDGWQDANGAVFHCAVGYIPGDASRAERGGAAPSE